MAASPDDRALRRHELEARDSSPSSQRNYPRPAVLLVSQPQRSTMHSNLVPGGSKLYEGAVRSSVSAILSLTWPGEWSLAELQ